LTPTPKPVVNVARRVEAWRDEQLADPRHSERVAAVLGIALGVSFFSCFITGIISHLVQHPTSWFNWPARPAGLYRFTQGLHIATGVAAVPLLFAKLWSVFPRLFSWPLFNDPLHALERLSLLPLVGGSLFMLITGVANIELWYPWPFFFPAGHYAVAFVVMGALLIHIVSKAATTSRVLRRSAALSVSMNDESVLIDQPAASLAAASARRRFLGFAAATSGGLVLATVGQTVSPLRKLSLLAPRRPDIGVQGFPVNKTAAEASVTQTASDPGYTLTIEASRKVLKTFTLADLAAMPSRSATLPIACVEGWSANREWTGVSLRALLDAAGVEQGVKVRVESLQKGGRYRASTINYEQVADEDTLLAMSVDGEPLAPDHGYPIRLIGPNRPGVLQTKWIAKVVVL
jgi:DMSO/TMAO reductase YedYZ molybdopterin-dependent catalytic subunit